MPIPYISFTEVDTGVSAVQPRVKNRIAIVGNFNRGPANIPTYITGYTDFAQRYGSDTTEGSLAFQAAFDQLTPSEANLGILRVLGRAQSAKGAALLNGNSTKEVILNFQLTLVGPVVEVTSTINASIVSSGIYTGTRTGRYHFYVSSIANNIATIKYVLKEVGESNPNFGTVTTTFTVDLIQDAGEIIDIPDNDGVRLTFGVTGQTDPIELDAGDYFTVRVNYFNYPILISPGLQREQILNLIVQELSGRQPLGEVLINNNQDGIIFELEESASGSLGNRYYYTLTLSDNTAGIAVNPSITTAMTGGLNGPRQAFKDFYTSNSLPLLRIQAVSEGSWGNSLQVSITSVGTDRFRLLIQDLNASKFNPPLDSESYILDFSNTDSDGEIIQLRTSKYVRGFFLPKLLAFTNGTNTFNINLLTAVPMRIAPVNFSQTNTEDPTHFSYVGSRKLQEVSLEQGWNGPSLTDNDYIEALKTLETFPAHIIMCAGNESYTVQQALIAHCERAAELEGLRIAVISAPPNLGIEKLKTEMVGIDSTRAVKVAGWCTYAGQPNAPSFSVPATAFYAGKLASTPYYMSPAATGLVGPVVGLVDVDTRALSKKSLDLYEEAGLEILGLDPARLSYTFFTGRTTSRSSNWSRIYYRRTFDYIRQDLFLLLQDYKSRPHTELLRAQIASTVNNYFTELVRRAEIVNFKQAIVDGSNNSFTTYYANQLNVSVSFLPLAAADYINVTLIRDSTSGEIVFGG